MKSLVILAVTALTLCNARAAAQCSDTSSIGVIRIVKKAAVRDTGRFKAPAGYVDPGFIRPVCGGVINDKRHIGDCFGGVQYFNYTYMQMGVQASRDHFPSTVGINIEGNFDKNIYGASIFMQQHVLQKQWLFADAGAVSSSYSANENILYTAGPYVAVMLPYHCISNFQLYYGYNFLLSPSSTNHGERISVTGMNTHFIALRYRLPIYL
jgi:hypothetical protein